MQIGSLAIFILVYLGMVLGSWPGLAIDRTGIALLGAIAFIELQNITIGEATQYIDAPSLAILFSFMIISAQFYYSGFYTKVVQEWDKRNFTPRKLLFNIIVASALLSAILINDIVCLALTPLIINICSKKNLNPIPFLLGLVFSSNIGSALTLIGNPQNLLIGQVKEISFTGYLQFSFVPCFLSLLATWAIIVFLYQKNWYASHDIKSLKEITYDNWQSKKGIVVICIVLFFFIFTNLPRDKISLAAAGILLLSRKMASKTILNFIDWQLLVLFIGLFIVNKSFLQMNSLSSISNYLPLSFIDLNNPFWLIAVVVITSNLISNVPAVMLMLPFIETDFQGSLLAIASTFAGNLFIVGSIANIIVVTQASNMGITIDWKKYLKLGFPITMGSFLILIVWLYVWQFLI
ncbi:Inner membrane protein YbiR [Candidatus Rubidus massiliensis]|nr:MAG: hypothetical protein BGO10_09835 [Chlamydia sp. 32-24]CDZ80222.1 Inner membrane protein YbiR [Candidatus Rubidus massiliensis]